MKIDDDAAELFAFVVRALEAAGIKTASNPYLKDPNGAKGDA